MFREHHSSTIGAEAYIPHLDRNAEGLHAQEIRFPRALLKTILRDRKTLALPDGTVLEPPPLDIPGRKIVILGDTSDASAVEPIAMDASVLVHESTNAYMPKEITDKVKGLGTSKGTVDTVRKKAIGRGHSTADMAGEFAKKIRAKRLYLNHFSTKYVFRSSLLELACLESAHRLLIGSVLGAIHHRLRQKQGHHHEGSTLQPPELDKGKLNS